MRITCPSCDTSYQIADEKIGAKGRAVRCASCGWKWHVSLAEAADPDMSWPDPSPDGGSGDSVAVAAAPGPQAMQAARGMPPAAADPEDAARSLQGSPEDQQAAREIAAEIVQLGRRKDPDIGRRKDIESVAKVAKIKPSPAKSTKSRALRRLDPERYLARARPMVGLLVLLVSICVFPAVLVFRASMVAAFPGLAQLYERIGLPVNLRGLVFQKVEMFREVDNAQPVLVVEGEVENPTTVERLVPSIRFALRGDDQQEIYAWSIDPKTTTLNPGANLRFRTRLASPPEQASDIHVRFIERRNQQAAVR